MSQGYFQMRLSDLGLNNDIYDFSDYRPKAEDASPYLPYENNS